MLPGSRCQVQSLISWRLSGFHRDGLLLGSRTPETLEQRSATRLDNEMLMYQNLVKAHHVAKSKCEFEALVIEESISSGKTSLRDAMRRQLPRRPPQAR